MTLGGLHDYKTETIFNEMGSSQNKSMSLSCHHFPLSLYLVPSKQWSKFGLCTAPESHKKWPFYKKKISPPLQTWRRKLGVWKAKHIETQFLYKTAFLFLSCWEHFEQTSMYTGITFTWTGFEWWFEQFSTTINKRNQLLYRKYHR